MAKIPKKLPEKFLKPAPGCLVRDVLTRIPLKEEGEWKPTTTYWLRRIRMGDVVECKPPRTESKPSTKAEASK